MKKLFKATLLVAAMACLAIAMAFAGCGKKGETLSGEYKYENPYSAGSYYGIKVDVTVKDNVISKVKVVDSDYTSVTASWENKAVWNDGLDALLAKYEGKNVVDVWKTPVETKSDGTPTSVGGDLLISGATQGSGRLLLAVKAAIGKLEMTLPGEYKYENPYSAGSYYGIKVDVTVKEGKVLKVKVVDSDYTSVTASWDNKAVWNDGLDALLAKYEGKTFTEILMAHVETKTDGTPTSVSDSNLLITGATQGSGRLLLAVQNAIVG